METLTLVSLLGLLGVLSRYGIDQLFASWNEQFPVTTLLVNIVGSMIAGTVYAISANREFSNSLQTALLVGFCGGFTTFSAYTLQTLSMLERGRSGPAVGYLLMSPTLGLLAAYASVLLIRKLIS